MDVMNKWFKKHKNNAKDDTHIATVDLKSVEEGLLLPSTVNVTKTINMCGVCNSLKNLYTSSKCGNSFTILDFYNFRCVEHIGIGDDSFMLVNTFRIDGLTRLKTLTIGFNSFTMVTPKHWRMVFSNRIYLRKLKNTSRSFHIVNCEKLETIEIQSFSFSDFAGQFELKNLPSLQSIRIGSFDDINNLSMNFHYSSFQLGGNLDSFLLSLDLPSLKYLYLGGGVFGRSLITKLESTLLSANYIV